MQINDFIEKIEKNKIAIIRIWFNLSTTENIIINNKIDKELFIRRYSFGVIEHFIQVIKKEEETEKSHAIVDFLRYLKKQNLKPNELFLLFLL